MSWYRETWANAFVLPAAVCAVVAWFGLLRHFGGKGRLLGSRRSAGLALSVVGLMCGVAIGVGLLLPHLAKVPPAAVGIGMGATALPRKKQDESTQPYVKLMTLGIAWLMERLEYRIHTDGLAWCEKLVEDIDQSAQLRLLAHDVKQFLLERHRQTTLVKTINAAYTDAESAIDKAMEVQTQTDQACDVHTPWRRREPTELELFECRRAMGQARATCVHLLLLAYQHGRTSEQAELEVLRAKIAPNDAYRSNCVPSQRRWFDRMRNRH
ncbi:hypothetical protein [Streptomyces collinus]|uniref:hypothetical protein n=1 Tax=Streptomyces collinus TaxID=42684 RepID=UPI00363C2A7C